MLLQMKLCLGAVAGGGQKATQMQGRKSPKVGLEVGQLRARWPCQIC